MANKQEDENLNEQNAQDENLNELASRLKNIYISENDLLSISLDFSDVYFKRKEVEEEEFDKFWASDSLQNMVTAATQEAVTLALATLTLKEEINFEGLINLIINWNLQKKYIDDLATDLLDKKALKDFVYTLRREVFSRVYSQSKAIIAVSGIDIEMINSRKNKFMEMNNGEV